MKAIGRLDGVVLGHDSTLDEPVKNTILRDLTSIWDKLYYVLLPKSRNDKGAGLRQWDLWGPLLLCLALSIILSLKASAGEAGRVFGMVYVIVWVGSGVVTLNALLLGGKISFFQSVCVLGYCIFPLDLAALICFFVPILLVKAFVVIIGFVWATGASVGFMSELVPEDRRLLGVYPVWLFYVAVAWMIMLSFLN
eukprot:GHVL01005072.1.p1 GENE.GHVL01005072.1~~GHVL01005072.1.p1  ORF type:complete len:195 (+),score=18.97 GHVL01005072.1:23-607(+)